MIVTWLMMALTITIMIITDEIDDEDDYNTDDKDEQLDNNGTKATPLPLPPFPSPLGPGQRERRIRLYPRRLRDPLRSVPQLRPDGGGRALRRAAVRHRRAAGKSSAGRDQQGVSHGGFSVSLSIFPFFSISGSFFFLVFSPFFLVLSLCFSFFLS